jgi:formyl-CoA transferase
MDGANSGDKSSADAQGERRPLVDNGSVAGRGPLAGVRVLEFSQIVAGPVAGLNLADLGADVIKVEPLRGDAHRFVGTSVPGESTMFQGNNRGKRGLVVDLQDRRGLDLIYRMMPRTDVVVINYRPGVAERLGLDYETLRGLRADLIYAHIDGFGERGPLAGRGGSDIVAQAHSGLMGTEAKFDAAGNIGYIAVPVADYAAGFAVAMAVCAALLHREQTGEGQRISTSLLRLGLFLQNRYVMREPVSDSAVRDPVYERLRQARARGATARELAEIRTPRSRLASPFALYYRAYEASDGTVVLGALTPANRDALRAVLGIEGEHSDDADYDAREPENLAAIERWKPWIAARMLEKTVDQWIELIAAAGVPVARMNFPEDMADDEQALADGMILDLDHTITGPQRVVGPAVLMSATPTGSALPAPAFGEHTASVLREFGVGEEEVAALRAAGVVRGLG